MLGNIEDLMIKGYDGNLCFERDFVSEGLDMISRFTVPSDVPDFSKEELENAIEAYNHRDRRYGLIKEEQ